MTHELPPLPYENDALEPVIDTRTMVLHHDKHHQAYVTNLNKALEAYPDMQRKTTLELLGNLDAVPAEIRTAVRNHGGGHANHSMFWKSMRPGGGKMDASLADTLRDAFGSYLDFQEAFSQAAAGLFGSGWTWLCLDQEGELLITTTPNQDNPFSQGLIPLLGLDVWEHAYYLKYENRRADYIAAWWSIVNWRYVSGNYSTSKFTLEARQAAEDLKEWAEDTWARIEQAFSRSDDD